MVANLNALGANFSGNVLVIVFEFDHDFMCRFVNIAIGIVRIKFVDIVYVNRL